jgi:hypothetical protein
MNQVHIPNYLFSVSPVKVTNGYLKLSAEKSLVANKIQIIDISGRIVKTFSGLEQVDGRILNVDNLVQGMYFIAIQNQQNTGIKQFIIQ